MEFQENMTYIFLAVILFGILGNLSNLVIFSRTNMKKSTTFRFLFYLSIADLFVLLNCCFDGLFTYGYRIELRTFSLFFCRLHSFLAYYLTHLSSVILMVVNIERAFTVCLGRNEFSLFSLFKRRKMRTNDELEEENSEMKNFSLISHRDITISKSTNSKIVTNQRGQSIRINMCDISNVIQMDRIRKTMILILICLLFLNAHFFFGLKINEIDIKNNMTILQDENKQVITTLSTNESNNKSISYNETKFYYEVCYALEHTYYHKFLSNIWIYIDISTYSMLPFITMVICSSLILNEARKSREFFKNVNKNQNLKMKRKKRDNRMTLMILITNLYFIGCSLPYTISYNIIYKNDTNAKSESFFQMILHLLAYSNNSFNFIFYGFFSQQYREEFRLQMSNLFSKTALIRRREELNMTSTSRKTHLSAVQSKSITLTHYQMQ